MCLLSELLAEKYGIDKVSGAKSKPLFTYSPGPVAWIGGGAALGAGLGNVTSRLAERRQGYANREADTYTGATLGALLGAGAWGLGRSSKSTRMLLGAGLLASPWVL